MKSKAATKPPSTKDVVLQGFIIAITGFSESDYVKVAKLATVLGAQVETQMTRRLACLVAKSMGGPLCDIAYKLKVPIVGVHYLQETQAQQKLLPLERYQLTPFYKLTITCTGLSMEDRKQLKSSVENLGGRFDLNLEKDVSTHLVASAPSGTKYEFAKTWGNIHIVNTKWVEECLKSKRWVPEAAYSIEPPPLPNPISNEPQPSQSSTTTQEQNERIPTITKILARDSSFLDLNEVGDIAMPTKKKRKRTTMELIEELETYLLSTATVSDLPSISMFRNDREDVLFAEEVFVYGYPREIRDYIIRSILRAGGHVTMVVTQTTRWIALGRDTPDLLRRQVLHHPVSLRPINLVWILENLYPASSWQSLVTTWQP